LQVRIATRHALMMWNDFAYRGLAGEAGWIAKAGNEIVEFEN
jgi:hypothetical protein